MSLTKNEKIVKDDMEKRGFDIVRCTQKGYPDFKAFNLKMKDFFYLEVKSTIPYFSFLQYKNFHNIKEKIILALVSNKDIKYISYKTHKLMFRTIRKDYKVKIEPNIKCKNCNYEWYTTSKLLTVSCPSCGSKNKNKIIEKI